jgi:hypothetical protein
MGLRANYARRLGPATGERGRALARAYGWRIVFTAVTANDLFTSTSSSVPSDFRTCAS